MELMETQVSSQLILESRVFSVTRDDILLPDGKPALRDVVHHSGGVGVLAVDSERQVYLVRQYRYGAGKALLEIPAGKLEVGEDPAACGLRELREEVGLMAGRFEPFGRAYPTPAYDTEVIHLYLARELTEVGACLDEDEWLEVVRMPLEEAVTLALRGDIEDAKTQIALLKAKVLQV